MNYSDLDKFIDAVYKMRIKTWTKLEKIIIENDFPETEKFHADFLFELESQIWVYDDNEEQKDGKLLKRLRKKINQGSTILFQLKIEHSNVFIKSTPKGLFQNSELTNDYFNKLESIRLSEESLTNNHGHFFEEFVSEYLNDLGINNLKTSGSGDYGIDIIGEYKIVLSSDMDPSIKIVNKSSYLFIQCKMYGTKVGVPDLRKLLGDIMFFRTENHSVMQDSNTLKHKPVIPIFVSHQGYKSISHEFGINQGITLWESKDIISNLIALKKRKKVNALEVLEKKFKQTSKEK